MDRIKAIILLSVFLMLAGCSYDPNKLSHTIEAKQAAEPLIEALRAYKDAHGEYPAQIDHVQLSKLENDDIKKYEIRYLAFNSGRGYTLAFDPPGPAFMCAYGEGFDKIAARWQCLMK